MSPRLTFLSRLQDLARERPDHPALVSADRVILFRELALLVEAAAAHLDGVMPDNGRPVGVTITDEIEHLVAVLGLMAAGRSVITLGSHETEPSRATLAARAGVTLVLADADHGAPQGVAAAIWPGSLALPPAISPRPAGPAMSPTLLLSTSGTMGGANLIPFSEAQIALQSLRHPEYDTERLLRLASIEYNNSKRHRLYCLWMGGTNVFRPAGALASAIDFALDHDVSCLDISRMHVSEILTLPDPARLKDVKVRTGGSEVPWDLRRRVLAEVTPQLFVRYATSEFGAVAMAGPGDHDEEAPCGRPVSGVALEVVDDDGPLAVGEIGEIRLRAEGMATGYFENPEMTALRFRDGWFYPGDAGRLRPDGQVVVLGRKDGMINLNGINIFPAEIEQVLERHPDVAASAALPIASGIHGQIPVAVVELKPGATVTTAGLMAYAREKLAVRTPRRILIVEAMPRNPQGKILRGEIAYLFRSRRD
jgi:acyl-CoA synthetase (AMP-forming)/AMP-acid ligase II